MRIRDIILELLKYLAIASVWSFVITAIIALFVCCKTERHVEKQSHTETELSVRQIHNDSINTYFQQSSFSDILQKASAGSNTTIIIYDTQSPIDSATGKHPIKLQYIRRDSIVSCIAKTDTTNTTISNLESTNTETTWAKNETSSTDIKENNTTDIGMSQRSITGAILFVSVILALITVKKQQDNG